MKKLVSLSFALFILINLAYSQYDRGRSYDYEDGESLSLQSVGLAILFGAVFAVVGYVLMQIKALSGFGKLLVGIGAFVGIGTVALFIISFVLKIVAAAVSIGLKIAVIVGGLFLVGYAIRSIYDRISK
jgi:hypothetical protein